MNPLRIGVLGCGQIAVEQHLPVLSALPDTRITWLADIDEKSAAQVAQVYGSRVASLRHLAAALGDIDVLLVTAPYGARGPYYEVIRTTNPELAVFVEKPFARTVVEHLEISTMRRPGRIACGLSRRATPNVIAVKHMLLDGFWGKLRECRFALGGIGGYSAGEKYYSDPKLAGGGMLIEVGVHCLDAVLHCTGARPTGTLEGSMILDGGFDVHTDARVQLGLPDGSTVPFSFRTTMLEETDGNIELVFDHHRVVFSLFDTAGVRASRLGSDFFVRVAAGDANASSFRSLAKFWQRFFTAVRTNEPNETSAMDSIGVTRILEAAYGLARSRSVVLPGGSETGGAS